MERAVSGKTITFALFQCQGVLKMPENEAPQGGAERSSDLCLLQPADLPSVRHRHDQRARL